MANLAFKSVFITGTSRGLGLEFVKQLIAIPQPPKHVFATCRQPEAAKELQELSAKYPGLHIHQFDVLNYASYAGIVEWVEGILNGEGLNVLINNAATMHRDGLSEVTRDSLMSEIENNAVAPLMLCKAFLPLLKKSASTSSVNGLSVNKAAIINMSTMMACIADNTSGGIYPYRTSKAAINMITKSLSVDVKPDGILALVLHPGWVRTDMGGPKGLIDVQESVSGMLKVLGGLSEKDSGRFLKYNGDELPW
jgi:NAD(P)-dependent dehydrogenase (short-subunit alcohol dehydrogenase family)